MTSVQIAISGMTCAGCVSRIEKALAEVPGGQSVAANLAERQMAVTGHADIDSLLASLVKAGYLGERVESEQEGRLHREAEEQRQYRHLL